LENNYRVGIIGAGAIVESSHIPVLKVLPGISIQWVYDRDTSRSQLVSKMFRIPVLENEEMEKAIEDIDICLLTIPYGARRKYIELCAAKGKALYVEKPFAITAGEHIDYCKLFQPYELAIGFQRRYYQTAGLLKNLVRSELFGRLQKIQFNQGYFALKGNKPFLSDAALAGGGVIIESAIHTLDQLLLITGATAVNVKDALSLQKNGIDYDSKFETVLSGKDIFIEVGAGISSMRNLSNGVHFFFEHASVMCSMSPDEKPGIFDKNGKRLSLDIGRIENGDNAGENARSIGAAFYFFWKDFLSAIGTKSPNMTSAVNSLLTTSWIEQVYTKINHRS